MSGIVARSLLLLSGSPSDNTLGWSRAGRQGAVLIAGLALAACGSSTVDEPDVPALTVQDLAAPDRQESQPLKAPANLVDEVPDTWVSRTGDLTTILEQTARASLLDGEVWRATDPTTVTAAILEPYEKVLDFDLDPSSLVDDFQDKAPDGAKVITKIASVFPPDEQPAGDPMVYKAAWEVAPVDDADGMSDSTRFRLVAWVGYPVTTKVDQTPVVIGRQFDLTIARTDDGGTNYVINAGAETFGRIMDDCSAVLDGVLRPRNRIGPESIALLQQEFASSEANAPSDVATAVAKSEGDAQIDIEDQESACVAEAG